MLPALVRMGGLEIGTHDVFVVLGVAVAVLVFRHESRRRRVDDPRLWTIAAGAILTGAVFAKLGTGWRYLAEDPEPSLFGLWVHGGKTLLGGLAGAYLGALVTKRLIGYPHRTGDLFAPAVALGIAVGRIGCFLTEPIGTPTSMPWGISVSTEVGPRSPTARSAPPEFRFTHRFSMRSRRCLPSMWCCACWSRASTFRGSCSRSSSSATEVSASWWSSFVATTRSPSDSVVLRSSYS